MAVKKLSLVKYAGEFWVTLSDYSETRDTTGYSGEASVKSAVRTFVVKSNPDYYLAFRGELQLKNIAHENKDNPLFQLEDFQGTRQALIHWNMLDKLNERFSVSKVYKQAFAQFMNDCTEYMKKEAEKQNVVATVDINNPLESRSVVIRQLRQELSRIDKNIEVSQRNREKLLAAINSIESLEIEE